MGLEGCSPHSHDSLGMDGKGNVATIKVKTDYKKYSKRLGSPRFVNHLTGYRQSDLLPMC